MSKKFLKGMIAAGALFLLPGLWKQAVFDYPHLWILFAIGILASVTQPSFTPVGGTAPKQDRGTATRIVWTVYLTQIGGVVES